MTVECSGDSGSSREMTDAKSVASSTRPSRPVRLIQPEVRTLQRDMLLAANPNAYSIRMAKVSVSIPDDIVEAAKAAGLNISRLAAVALTNELDRRAKVAELDAYLAHLDETLGPVSADEATEAAQWAARFDVGDATDEVHARHTA